MRAGLVKAAVMDVVSRFCKESIETETRQRQYSRQGRQVTMLAAHQSADSCESFHQCASPLLAPGFDTLTADLCANLMEPRILQGIRCGTTAAAFPFSPILVYFKT